MTRKVVLGATIDGYAVEGGFDVEGGPMTTYSVAQSLGRCTPSVRTAGTFEHLANLIACAGDLGFSEIRLTMEWARLERSPGARDHRAMDAYVAALDAASRASMSAVVVLCDAALPSWMGQEPWLAPWAPPRFASHAAWVASCVEGLARSIVTFRSPNLAADEGWRDAQRPPFRKRATADRATALDGMLDAHRLAVDAIASAAPSLGRAAILQASSAYEHSMMIRDAARGMQDPVLLRARRDSWCSGLSERGVQTRSADRSGTVLASGAMQRLADAAPFEWWVAGDDPAMLAADLDFSQGEVETVELGASSRGWEAQLATGLDAITAGEHGASAVHLFGLVSSTGPVRGPVGLIDVDQHDGAWQVVAPSERLAARIAARR